ncbi:hypothetical protein NTE_02132 [Candidatus Nitrososphaera evergladensis SR1]|jgi:hypothetical protein|uniref:Uncharacterized protein n=1 Tax=Candidatus Nitrososphaera evergladensis SR1 TaxID=1459636 RepID=A0A075MTU6_9ARCH|nr:hypothetical protein [Candidatus Nitrososphaera evergladensis]AIF84187.1 hypothetical protein NTE_02132 [Candidatus Nitrososphaera evergladensis SR1]
MLVNGLIDKLLKARVAEKRDGELTFTNSFGGYLLCSISCSFIKIDTIQGWREILANFESSLANLTTEEIEATVMLLDYYLNHAQRAIVDER